MLNETLNFFVEHEFLIELYDSSQKSDHGLLIFLFKTYIFWIQLDLYNFPGVEYQWIPYRTDWICIYEKKKLRYTISIDVHIGTNRKTI